MRKKLLSGGSVQAEKYKAMEGHKNPGMVRRRLSLKLASGHYSDWNFKGSERSHVQLRVSPVTWALGCKSLFSVVEAAAECYFPLFSWLIDELI